MPILACLGQRLGIDRAHLKGLQIAALKGLALLLLTVVGRVGVGALAGHIGTLDLLEQIVHVKAAPDDGLKKLRRQRQRKPRPRRRPPG